MYTRRYIRKTNRPQTKRELSIQKALVKDLKQDYPDVTDFFNDWAAGAFLTPYQAKERKSMSSGRGWADLFVPYPINGYHGCFLELKREGVSTHCKTGLRKGELVADEQIRTEAAFLERMRKLGYYAEFAIGYEDARRHLARYLGHPRPENVELF